MDTLEKIERARKMLEQEAKALLELPLDDSIVKALQVVLRCKGKVVTSGMGKAGLVARKVSATFSSTGTPSVFLHPGEAQHGDLGVVDKNDVLLIFSNSGKTREAVELVELTHRLLRGGVPVITITSNLDSELSKLSSVALTIGQVHEICPLEMAPTTSTTAMMALGDVLCMLTMEEKGITKDDFLRRHHGGYLGLKHQEGE